MSKKKGKKFRHHAALQPCEIDAMFDGACEPRNPGGHGSYGWAVEIKGVIVSQGHGYCGFGPTMSNNVAEYMGVIRALEEASKFEGSIRVRGDSMLVVKQMTGRWKVRKGLYVPYFHAAKQLAVSLNRPIRFEWVPRSRNSFCDRLSKQELIDRGIRLEIQPERSVVDALKL